MRAVHIVIRHKSIVTTTTKTTGAVETAEQHAARDTQPNKTNYGIKATARSRRTRRMIPLRIRVELAPHSERFLKATHLTGDFVCTYCVSIRKATVVCFPSTHPHNIRSMDVSVFGYIRLGTTHTQVLIQID